MTHNKIIPLSIVIFIAFIAAACSSNLSKKECLNADWYIIGVEDGSQGYPLSRIGRHREACAKVSVVPDHQRYEEGLKKGYTSYCTRAGGYEIGQRGRTHHNVCTGEFITAYKHGYEMFEARARQNTLFDQIDRTKRDIAVSKNTIVEFEEEVVNDSTTEDQRRKLLTDIKNLQIHIADQYGLLDSLELDYLDAKEIVREVEHRHKTMGY